MTLAQKLEIIKKLGSDMLESIDVWQTLKKKQLALVDYVLYKRFTEKQNGSQLLVLG